MKNSLVFILISIILVSCSNFFMFRDTSEDWYLERMNINEEKFKNNTAGITLTISAQEEYTVGDSIFIHFTIKNTSIASQMLRSKHSYGYEDSSFSETIFTYGYEYESATQRVLFLDIVYPDTSDSKKYLIGHPFIKSLIPYNDDFILLYPDKEYVETIQVDDITYHVNKMGSYMITACYENYLDYPDTLYPINTWKGKIHSNTISIRIK